MGTLGRTFRAIFPSVTPTISLRCCEKRNRQEILSPLERHCGALSLLVRPKREIDDLANLFHEIG